MNLHINIATFFCLMVCLLNVKPTNQLDLETITKVTNEANELVTSATNTVKGAVGPIVNLVPGTDKLLTIVKTSQGSYQGITSTSRGGRTFFSFLGIRYAKPPVGDLRFAKPQPPDPSKDLQLAIKNGGTCLQKNYYLTGAPVLGQEDCLFLNVYTHQFAADNEVIVETVPVMVYFHNGAFASGTGSSTIQGPSFFMDEDIVIVAMNFRLGVFGYFSTGDDASPGNWGQYDQILAMKWVQENIEYFGGDPNRVTIFGHSSGAASVHYHTLSPSASGLFHQAILQSETALSFWDKPLEATEALQIAKKQAQLVDCPSDNTDDLVKCLRLVDGKKLVASVQGFKYFSNDPMVVYKPTIEIKSVKNPNPYIDDKPINLYLKDRIPNRVPWMIGTAGNEGVIRTGSIFTNLTERTELNKRFDELVPKILMLNGNFDSDVFDSLINFYMNGVHEVNTNTFQGFTDIFSDLIYNYPGAVAALVQLEYSPNVYYYEFNYKGQYSYSTIFAKSKDDFGVVHGDDLLYLFQQSFIAPALPPNDVRASQKLVKLWVNFATHGGPTTNCADCDVQWLPVTITDVKDGEEPSTGDFSYYYIYKSEDNEIAFTMKDKFFEDRMSFLDGLPFKDDIASLE